jgi:hypothetical protein
LSPLQKERFQALRAKSLVLFNAEDPTHHRTLFALATSTLGETFDEKELHSSTKWKHLGFQGLNPATDFRSGGLFSLQNLAYFVSTQYDAFLRMCKLNKDLTPIETKSQLSKQEQARELEQYYPFAICGINLTVLLSKLFSINKSFRELLSAEEQAVFSAFVALLQEDEYAFEEVYCGTFLYLHEHWTSYMEASKTFEVVKQHVKRTLLRKPVNLREFHGFMVDGESQ